MLKRWFDGLARGVPAAAAQAERAGTERTGDGTQPGRLRAAASARCCAARTGAAGQRKRAAGLARQNGHQNATKHPSETQPTTVSHHRALQESYIFFFFPVSVSFPMKSVSVCADKTQLEPMIYAPPRAVRRILPPSAGKVTQFFHPGGACVFKYLLLSSPTDQSRIPHQDSFCQNKFICMLNVIELIKCPQGILAFCPPICRSSILFHVQRPRGSSQLSFCFQANVLVLLFL